jgi:hypothetical protein
MVYLRTNLWVFVAGQDTRETAGVHVQRRVSGEGDATIAFVLGASVSKENGATRSSQVETDNYFNYIIDATQATLLTSATDVKASYKSLQQS